MSGGQEMTQLVRVGTVMVTDPGKRMARVLFRDTGTPSGWLYVLASRPFLPDADTKPQRTEETEGHRHDLRIKPWMPEVNAVVLVLFLPVNSGDGFILGEIWAEGAIKQ